ncbi:MAG: DMT family transporter [Mariprofundaceae bacterium]|nr:DMT family transporter [Mariprofundaceae bacterium]
MGSVFRRLTGAPSGRMRVLFLAALAMVAFAANSLLCRHALKYTEIDAASFSAIRLAAGAVLLWLVVWVRAPHSKQHGSWRSASALFVYVAGFSFAYIALPAATGALLLFGAVQVTMVTAGLISGERLNLQKSLGFVAALAGLVVLLLPGIASPSLAASLWMLASGIAWGLYSLAGRGGDNPVAESAGNFLRTLPMAAVLLLLALPWARFDVAGVLDAILSGALASGLGYVIWYAAVRDMAAVTAAAVQLSVPVIAAVGGILFLSEPLTPMFMLASLLTLGGIAVIVWQRRP